METTTTTTLPAEAARPWLLADLGGTNVRFALADPRGPRVLQDGSIRPYKVRDFGSLAEAARRYWDEQGGEAQGGGAPLPRRAVIAAAGPVDADGIRMTNHPWTLSRDGLQEELGLARLVLLNDFAALAACVPLLHDGELQALPGPTQARIAPPGAGRMHLVIGPGTGLGVAGLHLSESGRMTVLETEGGHAGFAPEDALEIALLQRLQARFGRVSRERLVCGPGLRNLYRALAEVEGAPDAEPPTPEAIVAAAGDGSDPRAAQALDRFCLLLAGVCGDMVLSLGAWDGVYLAGGLLLSLRERLQAPAFRQRFEAKGRFQGVLLRVPLWQIVHDMPGLLGAAGWARHHSSDPD